MLSGTERLVVVTHWEDYKRRLLPTKTENPVRVGGMCKETESDGGGEAAAAPGNPVVARRVPGKVRRLPRACAPEGCDGYYHVVSRINGRARLLTDTRREGFRELLGRVADFCGVEVLTYCFMECWWSRRAARCRWWGRISI